MRSSENVSAAAILQLPRSLWSVRQGRKVGSRSQVFEGGFPGGYEQDDDGRIDSL